MRRENSSLEMVRGLFGSKNGDFITAVDEKSIIVVKELAEMRRLSERWKRPPDMILDALPEDKKR